GKAELSLEYACFHPRACKSPHYPAQHLEGRIFRRKECSPGLCRSHTLFPTRAEYQQHRRLRFSTWFNLLLNSDFDLPIDRGETKASDDTSSSRRLHFGP